MPSLELNVFVVVRDAINANRARHVTGGKTWRLDSKLDVHGFITVAMVQIGTPTLGLDDLSFLRLYFLGTTTFSKDKFHEVIGPFESHTAKTNAFPPE